MALKVLYFRTSAISLRHTDIMLWTLDLINDTKTDRLRNHYGFDILYPFRSCEILLMWLILTADISGVMFFNLLILIRFFLFT